MKLKMDEEEEMRKRIWWAWLWLPLMVLAFYGFSWGGPKLWIKETEWNFGKIPANATISHVFWVKNIGTDTLRILSVKPGWGCSTAPVKKTELAVGDSTEIEFIYHASGSKGKVRKSAAVNTNDSSNVFTSIAFSAEGAGYPDSNFFATVSPLNLDFTPKGGKKISIASVEIRNTGKEKLEVKVIDYPKDFLEVKLSSENLRPNGKVVLKARLSGKTSATKFEKSITLEFNDKNKTRLTVPAKMDISPPKIPTQIQKTKKG